MSKKKVEKNTKLLSIIWYIYIYIVIRNIICIFTHAQAQHTPHTHFFYLIGTMELFFFFFFILSYLLISPSGIDVRTCENRVILHSLTCARRTYVTLLSYLKK